RAPPQLGFDRGTKPVGAERILTLQMQANVVEFGVITGLSHELPIRGTSLLSAGTEGEEGAVRLNQGVVNAAPIRAVAGPTIGARPGHHSGTHRVELDIAIAAQQIVLCID